MAFPGDTLLVTNRSSDTLSFKYDGRAINIPPSKVGYVPFEHVVHELGHPAAGLKEQKVTDPYGAFHMVPTRDEEIRRVQLKHNWDLGISDSIQGPLHPVPSFEVADQDGTVIWTVAQDPDGTHAMIPESHQPDVGDQIARMERQIQLLKKAADYPEVAGDVPDLAVPGPHAQSESELLTDDE